MVINEDFATWLRSEMDSRNWSQGELARRSGVSQSQISLLLQSRHAPRLDTLQLLARAFRMRKEDIFRQAGYLDPLPDDDTLAELQYLVTRLSTHERQRVLDFARYVDGRKPHVKPHVTVAESAPDYEADPCEVFHRLPPAAKNPALELLKLLAGEE